MIEINIAPNKKRYLQCIRDFFAKKSTVIKYCNSTKKPHKKFFAKNFSVHLVDDDPIMYKGRKQRLNSMGRCNAPRAAES